MLARSGLGRRGANVTVEWRPIAGYESFYEVSNAGEIRRVREGRGARLKVLKNKDRGVGYYTVSLCRDGIAHDFYIHELVAKAFIGSRPDGHEVNHKDTNKKNNAVDNLEWLTKGGNLKHSYDHGRSRPWGNQFRKRAS